MNVTPYFFGQFNNGYTQYPDDYANAIFQNFYINSKSITQIAIHREGDLMYYGYIRKLEQEKYIGFCVVINGLMLTKLDGLFLLYENAISNLVINGQLIQFNEQGNIVTNVDRLFMNREELDLLTQSFRAGFSHLKESLQPLPAVSYGVSKDSIKNFSIENDIVEIIKSSHTYGYTYIYKSKDFETTQINSYKEVLTRLNKEKTELAEKYEELAEVHEKIIRKKKQHRFVAILILLVLGCAIGLLYLNDNLNSTKLALNNANQTIKEQNDSLNSKNNQISSLDNKNRKLVACYQKEQLLSEETEKKYSQQRNNININRDNVVNKKPIAKKIYGLLEGKTYYVYTGTGCGIALRNRPLTQDETNEKNRCQRIRPDFESDWLKKINKDTYLGPIDEDDEVIYYSTKGKWYFVKDVKSGAEGYISASYSGKSTLIQSLE